MTSEKFARIVNKGESSEIWLPAFQTYACLYRLFDSEDDGVVSKLNYYINIDLKPGVSFEDSVRKICIPIKADIKNVFSVDHEKKSGHIWLSQKDIKRIIKLFEDAMIFLKGELTDNAESIFVFSEGEAGLDIQIGINSIDTPLSDDEEAEYIGSRIQYLDNKSITMEMSMRYLAFQIAHADVDLRKAHKALGNRDFWIIYTFKNKEPTNDPSSVRVVIEREPGSIQKVIQNVSGERSSVDILMPEQFHVSVMRPLLHKFADMNTTDAGFSVNKFFNNKKLFLSITNDGDVKIVSA